MYTDESGENAGSLDLNPAEYKCTFHPNQQDQAAQPARKCSSLGFAAKYAAQLMDDILTPGPIKLNPIST